MIKWFLFRLERMVVMEHIIDPKIKSTCDIIEASQPGFTATLGLAMYERRRECSLKDQEIADILTVTVGSNTRAFVNVTEIRCNGKKKEMCLILSWKDSLWRYNRRWPAKARIVAWSGKEKF